jgi:hypothetical protein
VTKYTIEGTGNQVDLNKDNFVFEGGEGAVYIIGDTAYKICKIDTMIPRSKFDELATLNHPNIIAPKQVLLDSKKRAIGYTMMAVPNNPMPLAQILTKTYREREGVTHEQMAKLVQKIRNGIEFVHKKNMLLVDGNEFNFMVTSDHAEVYFIDVNSYQTPNHRALAIMPSIRDYQVVLGADGYPTWTTLSDWFSFAVIAFNMFTAIHPFRGKHPSVARQYDTAMEDHMRANKSVLDHESKYPKGATYQPFEDVIPPVYMNWFRAVFIEGKRLPPPKELVGQIVFVAKVQKISGSNNFEMKEIFDYASPIRGYYYKNGVEVVPTTDKLYVGPRPQEMPPERFRVGFNQSSPIAMWTENKKVKLRELVSQKDIDFDGEADDMMSYDGRLYYLSGKNIFEVRFLEKMKKALPQHVASVSEYSTQLYQGVAIQQSFGTYFATVFPASGHATPIALKELANHKIVDAKCEKNVLMVLAMEGETGKYHRYIFRIDGDWDKYDSRKIEDITPMGLNFTVNDRGVVVCITEEEKVEIFSSKKDAPDVKSIVDPAISTDMRLCHKGDAVQFAKGTKLFQFSVKS